jgi:hypothetical protein
MWAATPAYQVKAELESGSESVVVFGLLNAAVVPDPSDLLFTVPPGGAGRLDLIAHKFFGTPELWWAIAQCNPEMDPMIGPQTSDVVQVPTRVRLASLGIINV